MGSIAATRAIACFLDRRPRPPPPACADAALVEDAFVEQELLHAPDRIAQRVLVALRFRTVSLFVVRQRMRVGTDHMAVHERRALAGAAIRDRLLHRAVAGERVGAVAFEHQQVGEIAHQAGDAASRGVHLDGHRDGVLVVFADEEHRHLQVAGASSAPPRTRLGWWCRHRWRRKRTSSPWKVTSFQAR